MFSFHRVTLTAVLFTASIALSASPRRQDPTDEILRSAANVSSIAVFVGGTDSLLLTRFAQQSNMILHVLTHEAAGLDAARRLLEAQGLAGRAIEELWTSPALPYPDHFVNLIVLEDPAAVPRAELLRVLTPGGVAWVRRDGRWSREQKPWPETFDAWTHARRGADGNMVSRDTAVAVPRSVRWIAGPVQRAADVVIGPETSVASPSKSGGKVPIQAVGHAMVSASGRNFFVLEDRIVARDAFNGTLLWARDLRAASFEEKARIKAPRRSLAVRDSRVEPVALGNALYVITEGKILVLDAANGKTSRELGGVAQPRELLVDSGLLAISDADGLCAYDFAAGGVAWKAPIRARRMVAGEDALFCVEEDQVVCLDLASGHQRWRSRDADAGKAATCTYQAGVLVLEMSTWWDAADGCGLVAISAHDGATLWKKGLFAEEWATNPLVRGPLTPAVTAGRLLVVAAPDMHRVVALDTDTGQVRWNFTVGGRVDTSPTLHAGLCLFGAHDGWVYALDASKGSLVWRFCAAPREARIAAYGQLESPWPVAGSVLVDNDTAYVAAGRHPMADGGVYVHAIRPRTGEVLWTRAVTDVPLVRWYGGRLPNSNTKIGQDFKPVDLLVRDGNRVSMSRWRFDPGTGEAQVALTNARYEGFDGQPVPRGLWGYGSPQAKRPDDRPAAFDEAGTHSGERDEVALVLAGGTRLAATDAGELRADGTVVFRLASAAVHDGLIAAHGRIYVSTQNGAVVCLESEVP